MIGDLEQGTIPPLSNPTSTPSLPDVPTSLSPTQQEQLQKLLQQFRDVFSQHLTAIGRTHLVTHQIHTHGPPIRQPAQWKYPIQQQEDDQHIQQMLYSGITRPSTSPWSSLVVLVQKKDGSTPFCVEYRKVKDATPLAHMNDSLDFLLGTQWFTTVDLPAP